VNVSVASFLSYIDNLYSYIDPSYSIFDDYMYVPITYYINLTDTVSMYNDRYGHYPKRGRLKR